MRLSRDKVNVLARAVADALKQMDEVEFIEDPNTIRQETRKILEELLNHEARIDQAARDRWMQLMTNALDETKLPPEADAVLRAFFDGMSSFMMNS